MENVAVVAAILGLVTQSAAHAKELPEPSEDWRARNRGPGMYSVFMMGPHRLDADLTEAFVDSRRWGAGFEFGYQLNQWLFGAHLWGNGMETPDEANPLRLAVGLNFGRRIPVTRHLAVRLGGAWHYNVLGACASGSSDPDDVTCLQPDTRWAYTGPGINVDAVLAWSAVGNSPVEGLNASLDLYSGVRYTRLWLHNGAIDASINGSAWVWLMGFSLHVHAIR